MVKCEKCLRSARIVIARNHADWYVDQHTHGPKIKVLAGRGEDISTAPPDHLPIYTHPSPALCVDDTCVEGVDTDLIVEDTGGGGRKGCPFECLPRDVGVMQRTVGAAPVVATKSAGSANCRPQNRNPHMGPKLPDPNAAQKNVLHGGRDVGVGGVGKVISPKIDGVLEISAEDVLLAAKSLGEFLPTPVLSSNTAV